MRAELDERERRELRRKTKIAMLHALQMLGGEACRADIRARALADGGFTARELAAPAPPTAAGKFDHLIDQQLAWALTNLKRDGLVENPSRSVWRLTHAAVEPAPNAVPEPIFADRLEELRRMSYREYLRTPEWRQTRAAALLRAGHRCSLDATHGGDLDVHHNNYERLGRELTSDLAVLCRACHELHHKQYGRPRRPSVPQSAVKSDTATARGDSLPATPHEPPMPAARPRRRSLLRRLLAP